MECSLHKTLAECTHAERTLHKAKCKCCGSVMFNVMLMIHGIEIICANKQCGACLRLTRSPEQMEAITATEILEAT